MTTPNQLIITFWLIQPEHDLHTPEQMREAGERGVYAPIFNSGERKMMRMECRFDRDDEKAVITAIAYALRNVKMLHGGGQIWGLEYWLNGEKLSNEKIP